MKKITLIFLVLSLFVQLYGMPDEGMWIPSKIAELNYAAMHKLGCKLTADQIYSINHSSLKDAIFQLQSKDGMGFCTGEMVSSQGLLFTNHHCGYEAITKLSSAEHNYLDNGYWAKTHADELHCPGLRVSRVVRIEDVTNAVLNGVDDKMDEAKRRTLVSKNINSIEKRTVDSEKTAGHDYEVSIAEMYKGSEYYLFVYEIFGDVRFVGAPPSAIGKFGGDTDNWMWPRHTGDFSIFRVYMSPDGKPTKDYDDKNIPYSPLHFLPVSAAGVNEGDFAMIMGYPGETERFLSSYGMKYKRDFFNPAAVNALEVKLNVMKADMSSDVNIKLAYADTYAGLANGHKLWKGEALTLKTTDAIAQKEQLERDFQQWADADPQRKAKYGNVLADLKKSYEAYGPATEEMLGMSLALLTASSQTMQGQIFMGLEKMLKDKKDKADIDAYLAPFKEQLLGDFDKYFPETDKKIFAASLKYYVKALPADRQNSVFTTFIMKRYKAKTVEAAIDRFLDAAYTKSIFTDKARMQAFMEKPTAKVLASDPMYGYVKAVFADVMRVQSAYLSAMRAITPCERVFIEGLREFQPNRVFYADANSTLRLTYGTVKAYKPCDAVSYNYVTYADGILEKENPADDEFIVPKELKDKILKKEYAGFADKTGKMPVCFLTDNDITGGNSGSPVINGKGELIGLAFDGNWEWLCSNLLFSNELERTINVDSRYVLWLIGDVYGAKNIIAELDVRH